MNIRSILKNTYLIDDALTEQLLSRGKVSKVAKGAFVLFCDKITEHIAIPLTGTLGFYPNVEEGANVSFNIITPGIIFNDVPYLLGGGSMNDVRAVSDCQVLLLPYSHVDELMRSSCAFSRMLSYSMARKQRFCLTLFHLRGEKNQSVKITKALNAISEITNDDSIPVNICVLASLLNMSRNTVGKYISHALDSNVLTKTALGYRLVDFDAIAA